MKQNAFVTTFLVSIALVTVGHAAALRTVALTGQPAPGTPSGVTYESFGAFQHPQDTNSYRAPILNDAGQVAFRANLTGSGIDSTNNQGIWSEGSGNLTIVTRTGNQAPGAASGVNFRIDPALELYTPVLNNAGQVAFYGAITDGGLGLWSEGSGALGLVARNGQQAPGTPDGAVFDFSILYEYLVDPILNDAGQTAFNSFLSGTDVIVDLNHHGVWSGDSDDLRLVARTGSQAPGLPDGVLFGFQNLLALNEAGQTAFHSFLRIGSGGVNTNNNRSIWSEGSGSLAMVARTGDQAPGLPSGVTFNGLFTATVAINNAGHIALVAGLSSENTAHRQDSIWSDRSGTLELVALRGTQAPGTAAGVNFEIFGAVLVMNESDQIVFRARLTGPGVNGDNDSGMWFEDSGSVNLITREGDHAPGTPSGINFSSFTDFGLASLNDAGQIAFGAVLAGTGVDSSNDRGIWATDTAGVVKLVARKGDPLELAPGDLRTISDLTFVGETGNSNGWPSGFNNLGQLVFWASFTDGSQGVFVSNAVAHLPGDFNNDGTVDAADYVVWRKGIATGTYTQADYDAWRTHFGRTLSAGSGSVLPSAEPLSATVPEPASAVVLAIAAVGLGLCTIRRHRNFADR